GILFRFPISLLLTNRIEARIGVATISLSFSQALIMVSRAFWNAVPTALTPDFIPLNAGRITLFHADRTAPPMAENIGLKMLSHSQRMTGASTLRMKALTALKIGRTTTFHQVRITLLMKLKIV